MNLPEGQVRQVGDYPLTIDAGALITAERDLEKGFHVVVWESYDRWSSA